MNYVQNINEPISKVHSEVITVGTTKVQLPSHPGSSWVEIGHQHPTAKVYYGGSDLTLSNGYGALSTGDTTERYPVIDTSVLYVISDTSGVSLQILWGE